MNSKHRFLAYSYYHDLYTKMNLSLEDLFMTVLEDGLNEQNALITLMVAHEIKAMKIITITRGFIMRRRKRSNMKYQWCHLLLVHPKIYLIVAKIMMGINIEYDDTDSTELFKKYKGVHKGVTRSRICWRDYLRATKN